MEVGLRRRSDLQGEQSHVWPQWRGRGHATRHGGEGRRRSRRQRLRGADANVGLLADCEGGLPLLPYKEGGCTAAPAI